MANQFSIIRVDEVEKVRDYVTLVAPEVACSRGLVPEAVVGVLSRTLEDDEKITPEVFVRNSVFVKFMHDLIAHMASNDRALQAEARRQVNGWVYVIDQRTPDPSGTVPREDVVGSFQIANGKIVPESYQPNPAHRIFSSKGFFDLGPTLNALLLDKVLSCYS